MLRPSPSPSPRAAWSMLSVWGSLLASSSLGCVSRNDFPGSTVAVSGDKNHADSRESSGDGLVPAKYLREDLRRVT
ncbi:uncharacterized protein FFB20_07922 [Fusarium fujikuroi]|nr:uncharacterized protein FFB20_07922 [Fusarium fujikuroi]SCN92634.1 uncharacterized protein FFE2_07426 [Fusarium fujikuroi]SCO42441.1 uncharacterized protein FFNC_08522 [Fusarium fujikuroi]SCV32217.1 uncharacterized protein FFFS_03184 [Fusarium fujikuroi]SCV51873.1 uncharacterized protein FFB14_12280 [Fusarium fujikuroi]